MKDHFDYKLESDFKKLDLKPPQKLSYKETYSICDLRTGGTIIGGVIEFMPTYNEEDGKPHKRDYIEVVKIRDDLYLKLEVDYVLY